MVVPKYAGFKLQVGDEMVDMRDRISIYVVQKITGSSVQLRSIEDRAIGWAPADQVILVETGIDFFSAQIRERSLDAFNYAMRARLYLEKNAADLCLADASEAIRLDPSRAWVFETRGRAHNHNKDFDHAIADFSEAIRLDPRRVGAYVDRADASVAKGATDAAITDYNNAIRLDPRSYRALINRGSMWLREKEYDMAILDFGEAIRLHPQKPVSYGERGYAWLNKYDAGKALSDFNEEIRRFEALRRKSGGESFDQRLARYYFGRGCAWSLKDEDEKAIADFTEAIRLDSRKGLYYKMRALTWREIGRITEATADERMAARLPDM
jgi:tetratricopeptide (TPR) repeat protein